MEPLRPSDPRAVGPWQLQSRIGSGGMGVVFLAQRGTQLAALKVVRDSYLDTFDARARFKREVNVLRQVHGRFVAAIIEADMDADPAWIASEFVAGVDLKAHVEAHGAFEPAQWELLASGLMLALAAVHAAKVVHRDIKPANILLSRDGPKLIDFGIAHTGDNTVLTTTGLAIGSPAWMAPEQVEAKVVGTAADVFCAGSVLLFAATGRAPWGSGSIAEVMGQIAVAEPDLSGLTARQQQLLRGLLEKDPARRPSAAQAAQLLTDTTSAAGATQVVTAGWGEPAMVKAPTVLVNGQGTKTVANGEKYTGEWKDGVATDTGEIAKPGWLVWFVAGSCLMLIFLVGRYGANTNVSFNGQGAYTWAEGTAYTGEFKDGKVDGQGTLMCANGDRYIGKFKAGKRNGQGTQTFIDGGKYSGGWVDDRRNGQGTYTWPNGSRYTGGWVDDMNNGQGNYTWPNGDRYTGGFRDGKFMGRGTITYANGKRDHGWWSNGKREATQFSP